MDSAIRLQTNLKLFLGCLSFCLIFSTTKLIAQPDIFLPDYEFIHTINLSSYMLNDVEQLFQNPSSLTIKQNAEVFFMLQNKKWDYQQQNFAFIFPRNDYTFGLSISYFACNDIPFSPKTSTDTKPIISDYFSHEIRTSSFSIASQKWILNPSVKLTLISQKLANQQAKSMAVDLGWQWWITDIVWLGTYTRYLNQPNLIWNKSNITEKKDAELIFESGLQFYSLGYRISATNQFLRLSSEWLYKTLSLRPDIVLDLREKESKINILRYGIGMSVAFKQCVITYNYIDYNHQDLKEQSNQLGLTWLWN